MPVKYLCKCLLVTGEDGADEFFVRYTRCCGKSDRWKLSLVLQAMLKTSSSIFFNSFELNKPNSDHRGPRPGAFSTRNPAGTVNSSPAGSLRLIPASRKICSPDIGSRCRDITITCS